MPITASEGSSIVPVEAGTHHAVCFSIVDIGTHTNEKWNKTSREVVIGWELPDVRITVDRDGVKREEPRIISKRYTLSLHEKATLRQMLVSWRGRQFTADELKGFDLKNVLGANCLLTIVHNENGGKTYANIASVSSLPRAMTRTTPELPTVYFTLADLDLDATEVRWPGAIPQWQREQIESSAEYIARFGGGSGGAGSYGGDPGPQDDDMPF